MTLNWQIIAISFFHKILCKNVLRDMGLNDKWQRDFNPQILTRYVLVYYLKDILVFVNRTDQGHNMFFNLQGSLFKLMVKTIT